MPLRQTESDRTHRATVGAHNVRLGLLTLTAQVRLYQRGLYALTYLTHLTCLHDPKINRDGYAHYRQSSGRYTVCATGRIWEAQMLGFLIWAVQTGVAT